MRNIAAPYTLVWPPTKYACWGVKRLAVLILPGLLGVVAVVQEDSGCIPVELLLRHERAALQDEDVLAAFGEVKSQSSPTRPGAYDNRVKFAWRVHLVHGIRFTCLKIRIHCHPGPIDIVAPKLSRYHQLISGSQSRSGH
jgi:hypothetical protein